MATATTSPEATFDAPLLSNPTPSSSAATAVAGEDNFSDITYNHGPRRFQDIPFLILFLLVSVATFAFGIFALAHHNPRASSAASFSYNATAAACVLSTATPLEKTSSLPATTTAGLTLAVTAVLAAPLALLLLWSLRRFAKQVVYAALPFFVIIPVAVNVFWFVACAVSSSCRDAFPLAYRILIFLIVFLIIGVFVWIIVVNWHRIELTVWIIQVGAQALWENLKLFAVLILLGVGLVVYFVPIVVFLVFAPENGKVVPEVGQDGVYGCGWKQDGWVPAFFVLAIVTMLWTAATVVEAQSYVISGTIAQWYFAQESAPSGSIRSSLRNAFGPSFGTVCLSGLVIGAIRFIRASIDGARKEDGSRGGLILLLRCCADIVLSSIDFLNKFTINFAAITGEAYCSSARMTYELLRRNLLSAAFVETISTRILAGIIFILSALYAIVVCAILKAASALRFEAYVVAVLVFLLLFSLLGFFAYVLENVIDTIYVCYAIDKDKGDVCKQNVHEVYVQLPRTKSDPSDQNSHPRASLLA